jgi:hypothetical protein
MFGPFQHSYPNLNFAIFVGPYPSGASKATHSVRCAPSLCKGYTRVSISMFCTLKNRLEQKRFIPLGTGWMKPWVQAEARRHKSVDYGVRNPRPVSTWGPKIPPAVGTRQAPRRSAECYSVE